MPKRSDIHSVLIIGSGPIVIGQACEFDYSGVQACKALREENIRVILVNSNPATIMTDPDMADAIYIEPIKWQIVEEIIAKEKPDVILPTMGGQTALNCALDLVFHGVLEKHGVELIGATAEAIDKAEDRELFRKAMARIGLECPRAGLAKNLEEAEAIQKNIGFPTIIRPSFTLGGSGGGIAYNPVEFQEICKHGLDISPTHELLIEESVLGWKEYEMEVVRDKADNCIIICSIENLDPMGVHTGDSITVAPAQTLTDKEYQIMRDASIAVLREIGVETGGSNVQFAVDPKTGRLLVIEMNPRVSRSSALASKATGFPIAKIATKLAIGFTLDELKNEITGGKTPASFEPSIDYVVTKIPRFTFEKFPQANDRLTTQMKSVGEVMAMGKNFSESLQKAMRGLETGKSGFDPILPTGLDDEALKHHLRKELREPGAERLWFVGDAFRYGWTVEQVHEETRIDPWFLAYIQDIIDTEQTLQQTGLDNLKPHELKHVKSKGFSDARLASLLDTTESSIRKLRHTANIHPVYKRIDTCAAEFNTDTAYLYSSYDDTCEAKPTQGKEKMLILGGGPNRIGQGIEFDYCCVHAVQAMQEAGYETIMMNCNPETVSTDYDTSDRLYFEPLTLEDVLEVIEVEKPTGVIVQYGGQTPLKLARALHNANINIIGTPPDAIDLSEDRERFKELLQGLNLRQPANCTARSLAEAEVKAEEIGFPLVIRPSYVLGGRGMEIVHRKEDLIKYMENAVQVSNESPVLLDSYLNNAIEVDVDAVCDGEITVIGGIMEHIEQAGIHSGDSASSLPPYSLSAGILESIKQQTKLLAKHIGVVGLVNIQFAIQENATTGEQEIFIIEVNPRASRTIPFISKSIGRPLAKIAAKCMAGESLQSQGFTEQVQLRYFSVKESVFPFNKFPGVDPILGPEMKSTGEVMGVGKTFGEAFAKGLLSTNTELPDIGKVFISLRQADRERAVELSRALIAKGFQITATSGTANVLKEAGIECELLRKVSEGRPHVIDVMQNKEISFIVITLEDIIGLEDSTNIRRHALMHNICYTTTMPAAFAIIDAIDYRDNLNVYSVHQLNNDT